MTQDQDNTENNIQEPKKSRRTAPKKKVDTADLAVSSDTDISVSMDGTLETGLEPGEKAASAGSVKKTTRKSPAAKKSTSAKPSTKTSKDTLPEEATQPDTATLPASAVITAAADEEKKPKTRRSSSAAKKSAEPVITDAAQDAAAPSSSEEGEEKAPAPRARKRATTSKTTPKAADKPAAKPKAKAASSTMPDGDVEQGHILGDAQGDATRAVEKKKAPARRTRNSRTASAANTESANLPEGPSTQNVLPMADEAEHKIDVDKEASFAAPAPSSDTVLANAASGQEKAAPEQTDVSGTMPGNQVEPEPDMEQNKAPVMPYADDGVVTHILAPLDDRDDLDSQHRRSRRRSRRKRKPDMQTFQPEGFADVYPSAALSAILPLGGPFTFEAEDDFDDDGPQPALPNQPSLALPPAVEEEDLEALDEVVNGNRIDLPIGGQHDPRSGKKRRDKKGRGRLDTRGESRRAPLAPIAFTPPADDMLPGQAGQEKSADKRFPKQVPKGGPRADTVKPIADPLNVVSPGAPLEEALDDDLLLDDTPMPRTGKRVLYVSVVPEEQVEVVITDNSQVTEYFVEMAHQAKIRGNIYKGVINNVDTNLQAAFVNFGSGKNGFLQIDEVHPEYWLTHHDSTKGPKFPPIQKVLKVGQEVLVQVVKEPSGSKGAFLTTWVSLAGRFLVLTPGQEQIGVSRKVEDPEERARLKELLAGIDPGEDLGVIIRTVSEGASKTSIQKDLQFLKRLWKDIRKRATSEKSPSLIYQEADLASRAVRDYLAEDIQEIWVDDEGTLDSIRETTSLLFPRRTDLVKLHQDPRQTLWERFNLQRQLEEVTSREVVLPSGGRLVFDQTEALMAIDINSGKTQGKSNFEAMVFRTNMEAAEAIARHLRLRDIGGQVVIDFIEMRDRNHGRDVEKALRNAMRQDRARHDVGRMSSFGLLELVRQRTGTSAISISSEPCPHCHGTGVRRNMEWQALQALRELQAKMAKYAAQNNDVGKNRKGEAESVKPPFVHELDYELGLYLLNRKRDRFTELENRFGIKVEVHLKG